MESQKIGELFQKTLCIEINLGKNTLNHLNSRTTYLRCYLNADGAIGTTTVTVTTFLYTTDSEWLSMCLLFELNKCFFHTCYLFNDRI